MIQNDQVIKTITVGTNPCALTVLYGNQVFVVNAGSNTVSVLKKGEKIKDIAVGPNPHRIFAIGGKVYVLNGDSSTVSVIQDDQVKTIAVSKSPCKIFGIGGEIYVANEFDDTVTLIKDDQVIRHIPVGKNPVCDHTNPCDIVAMDGKIYVANRNGTTVSVIQDGKKIKEIELGGNNARFLYAFLGKIYVVRSGSWMVSVIQDDKKIKDIKLALFLSKCVGVPESQQLYVSMPNKNKLALIKGDQKIKEIEVGNSPLALAVMKKSSKEVQNMEGRLREFLFKNSLPDTFITYLGN